MYTATGKPNQKDSLLHQHATLVKKLAYQLKAKLPPSVELDDLVQAGMMGLLDAINRYEDTHGAQFETYAAQRIRGAMIDELRNADWLPRSIRKNMRDVEGAINQLEQVLGRPPTEGEVAKQLKMSLDDYYDMLGECSGHQLLYYEDFHESEGGDHFLDRFLQDDSGNPIKGLLDSNFRETLIEAIENLPEREQILMGLYYEQELNLKEIGAVMNVSESRVCQLHSQAIARLRAYMKEQLWTGAA
ncbi:MULTISPECIES: RNA polymerase sigma factor FliA [Methylovorus]|jgi:RNA polymerase sigma factor for flagellar operon FliA|uniref:RNA polymerase sigma factor FliA n=1 Tax=Methylovorus glucosotrophus (strain SIP3-4) TaxID=582744 RepID=C6XBW0_METGS|nr:MULTISPECIES: RNA polymerase sigma factor FliA [Methylovorus]ACT50035.1 RNA polymerase, sigma 28 subunit, FliA/WhiG [Methylovorus glucosotrophus SIP3-4]ADQ84007.1 RNA polymerase, sigma 28 subunit, FliA/WhiG [Methylovorus sp. MP688]KAF0844621.1 RNA polymerase sigma-28 (SigD/FliA/WhiG) subunit [Methylovorus glucosotrophus]MCB5207462.1 RNA polymerase sigma factor FliA [Methylovorus mays]